MLRAFALLLSLISPAAAEPVLTGLDHIPGAVSDLDRAKAGYEAMGFVLKPGRAHANGIRNLHAKFPDGTEIELITATAARDALSAEYVAWLKGGDGPPFAGFYTQEMIGLLGRISDLGSPLVFENGIASFRPESLLHHFFFGGRQKSPTDRPEHFAHPNTATALTGLWLAEDTVTESLLQLLDAARASGTRCAPFGPSTARMTFPEGDVSFVRTISPRPILGATVAIGSLETARRRLTEKSVRFEQNACAPESLWIAPEAAHGLWLELRQAARQ